MQRFSAVVYTAGRTGSHLIVKNLIRQYRVQPRFDSDIGFIDGVVHTHNPLYIPPNNNFIAIISQRQNLFDSIISMEVTKITNEFVAYSNKPITPYAISIEQFKDCYFFQKAFYQAIDRTLYNKVIEINYEDLISNPDALSAVNVKIDILLGNKSPYNYYELITNINELKEIYLQLEQIPITTKDVEQLKCTIGADLKDIRTNYNDNKAQKIWSWYRSLTSM